MDLFSRLAITTRIRATGWNQLTLQQKRSKIQEAQVNPTVEAQRKTGFKNLEGRRGRPSPHLKAIHQARRNLEPAAIAPLIRGGLVRRQNTLRTRVNKLRAFLSTKEVTDFLEKPIAFYTSNNLGEMHDRLATHYNWPTKWNSLNTLSKKRYSQKLHQWYEKLQT